MKISAVKNNKVQYGASLLNETIRSRTIEGVNDLSMHVLEAGFDDALNKPCIVLLHGFPEMAFSFRHQLKALANAGFYVVAPDQRGYGRTTGWDDSYEGDVGSFRFFNLVQDVVSLVGQLGLTSIHGVVGHDFGSPVAAWCALIRPDIFKSLVLMSAPFGGPPKFVSIGGPKVDGRGRPSSMDESLAALADPRVHYQTYYSRDNANEQMLGNGMGLLDFFKGYYFLKSAAYELNMPEPLLDWSAEQLAKLPRYYVMDLMRSMPETVSDMMAQLSSNHMPDWLNDDVMSVYAGEYEKNGFQGGLNWYRCSIDPKHNREMKIFASCKIEVPAIFIAGKADWGIYQAPGQLSKMKEIACTDMTVLPFVKGAGHWVQQERPEVVNSLLLDFFGRISRKG